MKLLNDIQYSEIDAEIKERRELIYQMVGWLYPSILKQEIEILQERKWKEKL
jgi:hypothetical protein